MDHSIQVISAAGSTHPVLFTGPERVPATLRICPRHSRPIKHLRCRSYQRLSCYIFSTSVRKNYIFLSRNQQFLIHALSLQAVTTDNGSEGSNSPGPSSSVDYACIFQEDEGARQSLLHDVQVWYNNARTQNIDSTLKEVFDKSKAELSSLDAKKVVKHLKSSKLDSYIIRWWRNTQPWIKWPAAIFVPWLLLISSVYGTSVSMDLIPLWIMGPVAAVLVIKGSIHLFALTRQVIAKSKLTAGFLFVYEEARSGQLFSLMMEAVGSKSEEIKWLIAKKKLDTVSYIESGQIIVVSRQYLEKLLLELWELSMDKYQDFRLFWHALGRKYKSII